MVRPARCPESDGTWLHLMCVASILICHCEFSIPSFLSCCANKLNLAETDTQIAGSMLAFLNAHKGTKQVNIHSQRHDQIGQ